MGETMSRYVVLCHCCSHGEIPCDELRDDQRCPHCQSVPYSYTDNGQDFCWLHREPLSGSYLISPNLFFTSYGWRGEEHRFPNAKLFEANGFEKSEHSGAFCPKCQEIYEVWLEEDRNG
jgi:hypothetical protein